MLFVWDCLEFRGVDNELSLSQTLVQSIHVLVSLISYLLNSLLGTASQQSKGIEIMETFPELLSCLVPIKLLTYWQVLLPSGQYKYIAAVMPACKRAAMR